MCFQDPLAGFRLFAKDQPHGSSDTLRALGLCFLIEHLGMALNAILFPFARARFGWDHRPFSVFLSYQSLLRLIGSGVVLPLLLKSGWVSSVGGSRVVISGALACRAIELLCFVMVDHGWELFAVRFSKKQ